MSRYCCGTVLTSGPSAKLVHFGRFEVICVRDSKHKSWRSTVKFLLLGLWHLVKAKYNKNPFELIVTYDPLKSGLIGLVLKKLLNTKLSVEVNGDYTDPVNYVEFDNLLYRKYKRFLFIHVERLVLNNSDGIKLLYDHQIDYFKPLNRSPVIQRFANYVNAKDFNNLGETKEVLFVGFPLVVKGVDILVNAFKKVARENPAWKLKILGDYGDYPEFDKLENLIASEDNIFHHPPVDPAEMPEHIGSCGIFVLPSRTEAMGRVLIEAMAAGKPRLGSKVGGIPTVIEDGIDGMLFKSEDVDDLASKLSTLMNDKSLRKRLSNNAKIRYKTEFQASHYFAKLERFYMAI